jgi:hypothetical protein
MAGFASAERRPRPCNRLVLRLDPCQTLVSAEGGHHRLAWRMHRHLFGARACQPCRRYLAAQAPALLAHIHEFFW